MKVLKKVYSKTDEHGYRHTILLLGLPTDESEQLKKIPGLKHVFSNFYCGYVGVPKGHCLYGVDYNDHCESLVHFWEDQLEGPVDKRGILSIFCASKDEATLSVAINVHGSVTFTGFHENDEEYWDIGFDCNHCDDTMETCTLQYVKQECINLAAQLWAIQDHENLITKPPNGSPGPPP